MYAFHVQVPAGVTELQVSLDTITYNGKSSLASSKVLDLVWNQVLLYPQGVATDAVQVAASVRLPARNFVRIDVTWNFTVCSEMPSR